MERSFDLAILDIKFNSFTSGSLKCRPNGAIPDSRTSVTGFIMISMAVYGAILASTSAGGAVAIERAQGWSRQLRLTPLSPAANIAVKIIGGLAVELLAVPATFATGIFLGVRMELHIWILAGLTAWLGSLVLTALGLLAGNLVPSETSCSSWDRSWPSWPSSAACSNP